MSDDVRMRMAGCYYDKKWNPLDIHVRWQVGCSWLKLSQSLIQCSGNVKIHILSGPFPKISEIAWDVQLTCLAKKSPPPTKLMAGTSKRPLLVKANHRPKPSNVGFHVTVVFGGVPNPNLFLVPLVISWKFCATTLLWQSYAQPTFSLQNIFSFGIFYWKNIGPETEKFTTQLCLPNNISPLSRYCKFVDVVFSTTNVVFAKSTFESSKTKSMYSSPVVFFK